MKHSPCIMSYYAIQISVNVLLQMSVCSTHNESFASKCLVKHAIRLQLERIGEKCHKTSLKTKTVGWTNHPDRKLNKIRIQSKNPADYRYHKARRILISISVRCWPLKYLTTINKNPKVSFRFLLFKKKSSTSKSLT